jgi:radical SAM protein with 4Fe4S-binding SPASM domain
LPYLPVFFYIALMNIDQTTDSGSSFDFFIQWHLTERCNLACTHCYQEGRAIGEMDLPGIKQTVHHISDTIRQWSDTYEIPFSASSNITGGEPFLRKDLGAILKELAEYHFSVSLLTNGTLIDRERVRMLADLPVRGVQVSLEGPEAIHEEIRGKRSFSSAMKGVELLLESGITVTLNVTLSEINVDHFKDMVAVATGLGVQRLGFSRLVPYGRGFGLISRMLSKEKVRAAYEEITSTKVSGLDIVTGDPVAAQLGDDEETDDDGDTFPVGGCAAGVSGITLLPDGTISPCRRMGISIGNVLNDSLREVWATSPVLAALRDRNSYKGKCRTCKRWSDCRGCRAIAYAYSLSQGRSDFLEEDPQCFI